MEEVRGALAGTDGWFVEPTGYAAIRCAAALSLAGHGAPDDRFEGIKVELTDSACF